MTHRFIISDNCLNTVKTNDLLASMFIYSSQNIDEIQIKKYNLKDINIALKKNEIINTNITIDVDDFIKKSLSIGANTLIFPFQSFEGVTLSEYIPDFINKCNRFNLKRGIYLNYHDKNKNGTKDHIDDIYDKLSIILNYSIDLLYIDNYWIVNSLYGVSKIKKILQLFINKGVKVHDKYCSDKIMEKRKLILDENKDYFNVKLLNDNDNNVNDNNLTLEKWKTIIVNNSDIDHIIKEKNILNDNGILTIYTFFKEDFKRCNDISNRSV